MIDVTTGKPLLVGGRDTIRPYIDVAVSQLDEVQRLLQEHGIHHWADEQAISFNGSPYMTVINFDRGADAEAIQAILDSVP
jgi:hypothetical protein